jgi:putative ABC transport system permease protein
VRLQDRFTNALNFMFKNYLKIAWRNLLRNRFYSFINIFGLTAGLTFTLLIGAYTWTELHVNRELKNAGRQYIIQSRWKEQNEGLELTTVGPLAKALKEQYPNLVASFYRWDGITVGASNGDRSFREGLQIGDSTLLTQYGFSLVHGDTRTALQQPFSVVLTEEKAKKYFGRNDVIGETVTLENAAGQKHGFRITGVLRNPYKNSVTFITDGNDNQFYVGAVNLDFFGRNMDWNNPYIVGYVELQPGVSPRDLESPMQLLLKQNAPQQVANDLHPYLVPLKQYYLESNNGMVLKTLYALAAIALFILLMAIVNFVNLSISRSATRLREIGVRKVMGGLQKQLMMQFLTESVLIAVLAALMAVVGYFVLRVPAGTLLQKQFPDLLQFPATLWLLLAALAVLAGGCGGLYPALALSALNAVESLKGKFGVVTKHSRFRKVLMAFQFGTATVAFIGAIVISQQVNLFFGHQLGFSKDYLMSVELPRDWSPQGVRHMEAIRQEFAHMPQIAAASLSFSVPNGASPASFGIYPAEKDSLQSISAVATYTDEYFADTYGIPMAAGQFFWQAGSRPDSTKMVINETMAKTLGYTHIADAIGQHLKTPGIPIVFTIAGVIRDFHFGSMQQAIPPMVFYNLRTFSAYRLFSFKLKPGDPAASLAAIQKKWTSLIPGAAFEYTFMDETLRRLYKTELQLKQAAYVATCLSIIIVLLGVLGLIALSLQRRLKEIGIRKVLGSSVQGIVLLFLKELLPTMLIAGIVACPVAWMLMQNWLQNYTYRTPMTVAPFILTLVVLALLTCLLVTIQTVRAALISPARSLKSE